MKLKRNSQRGGGRGSNKNKTFNEEGMGFFPEQPNKLDEQGDNTYINIVCIDIM